MNRLTAALLAGALLAALIAATPVAAQEQSRAKGPLILGDLAPETGELSSIVNSLRVPVQLAVAEINDAGGVNDQPVTLVTGDDGSLEAAQASFDRFVTTGDVDAIIGPSASTTALALIDDIRKERVVTCSGSTTSTTLSDADSDHYFFRTAPPDQLQARALAQLVLGKRHKNVAVLHSDDQYGSVMGRQVRTALAAGGANVVADVRYRVGATSYAREVELLGRAKPKALVVIGQVGDAGPVLKTLIDAGLGPRKIATYTTDGLQSSVLAATVDPADPSALAGVKGTVPAGAPAGLEHPFNARFAETGTDRIFSSYHYYDCTILTALAAVKARSDDPTKIRRAFRSNLEGTHDCNTFARCKQRLERGQSVHWRGASSSFDDFGGFEPREGVYDVWSFDDRGLVQVRDSSAQISVG